MSKFGRSYSTLIFVSAIFGITGSIASDLPAGWRFPTKEELKGDLIRDRSSEKYKDAVADFNGDGKDDYAYLVKSTSFSGEALVVKVSNHSKYDWLVLDQFDWGEEYPNVELIMGVSLVEPGEYKTACGKGYWECKDDEVPLLKLDLYAINYFRFSSAASFFYWDKKTSSFSRIWISD